MSSRARFDTLISQQECSALKIRAMELEAALQATLRCLNHVALSNHLDRDFYQAVKEQAELAISKATGGRE